MEAGSRIHALDVSLSANQTRFLNTITKARLPGSTPIIRPLGPMYCHLTVPSVIGSTIGSGS